MWRARTGFGTSIPVLLAAIAMTSTANVYCDDATRANGNPERHAAFARRVFAITDLVLERHVNPPTRQEMILEGLRATPVPASTKGWTEDSAGRLTDVRTAEELSALFENVWPDSMAPRLAEPDLEAKFLVGLMKSVPGGHRILPQKEVAVEAQFQGNRYVGIGIALGFDEKTGLQQMAHLIPGGPAAKSGARSRDLIEQIDGVDVAPRVSLRSVLDRLRGAEGTTVTLRLRQPDTAVSRTVSLVRQPVMIASVQASHFRSGATDDDANEEIHRIDSKFPIAYLRISSITASTPHELRTWESKLRAAGMKAVILDLRSCGSPGDFDAGHAAVLLADSLLDGNSIGRVWTRAGVAMSITPTGTVYSAAGRWLC